MKLHLPRLLFAALLSAFVSAPVYSATIPAGYESVTLNTTNELVGGTISAATAFVLFEHDYSVQRTESTTPFFTGSSILFTPVSDASTSTLTFVGGNSQAFHKVQNLSFEGLHRLSLKNMTSGAIYMEGNPEGERPKLTISGIDDGNSTLTDVDFYKNSISGNCGGAIQMAYSTITMNNNGEVRFFDNSATVAPVNNENQNQGSTSGGGASVAQNYTISLFGINLSFDFGFDVGFSYDHDDPKTPEVESMDICGGAINLLSSSLSLTENQHVYFTTNKAVDFGGAISASPGADSIVTISGNNKVTFRKNEATGVVVNNSSVTGGGGGAIFIGDHGSFVMSNNGDVVFEENLAATAGGAIYIGSQESGSNTQNLFWSENTGNISFAKNVAGAAGGAIFMESNGRLEMTGNTGVISFEQNRAGVSGGAISAQNARVTLNHNNQVVFRDNLVFHQKTSSHSSFPKPYYVGGAIHGTDIQIHGNNSVLFERNAEMDADGNFRLRSLYVNGDGSSEGPEVSLSAGTGQHIEFRDSIYVKVGLYLNSGYDNKLQNGDIIFTGVSTAEDLAKVKENWNKIVKENNLDQYVDTTVTTTEIENSRTSIVLANTNLQAGRLRVEKGAIFKGNHLLINNESILRIDDAKVVNIDQNGNIYNGSYVQIGTGATLEILGHSTIEGGTLKFSDASNWNVHLTKDNVGNSNAALTLKNSLMNIKGQLTLTLSLSGSNFTESFCLLNGSEASYANISGKWTKDNIKVVGTGDAAGATFDDLYWANGALYYESTLVWTNGEDTGLWTENDDKNWLNDRAFHYGANTKFTDVGEGGTVTLVGKIASAKVTVDNSKGVDYRFTGQDEEAGFLPGTDIVKRGEGSLTLDVATGKDANNDYAGSVSLEGGTLNLYDDNALGGSVLKTAEGTTLGVGDGADVVLKDKAHVIKGDVVVAEDSSLEIASGSTYMAPSSKVDGELIFDRAAAREAGTLAGSGNLVVKNGAAVEFKDASGFTGNVSVTGSSLFLTIADGILRAGEIAVNAGDLTLRATEQLTMAGGSVLSMVAGTVAEKVTTVVADKVIELAGNAMLAAMMNSMLGDLDKDGILNEAAAADVVGAGITLHAGSTLKLENCHIRLEGDNSCLTLNVTPKSTEKINLVLMLDDILPENGQVLLFSGADTVHFVYDGTKISGDGLYVCDANHYFTGSMVGADTKLVYSNGNVYMKGLVPEPATATLSLLALAALATRRRRR